MFQTRLAMFCGLVGIVLALCHPWIAPPLVGSDARTVWGGQQQQVQCWFPSDSPWWACKLNKGEEEGACADIPSSECFFNPITNERICQRGEARKVKTNELRRAVSKEDGYVVTTDENGNEVWEKKKGGSDKTKTENVACFIVETCRDKCALVGATYRCVGENTSDEDPKPHTDPDPNFPCPP